MNRLTHLNIVLHEPEIPQNTGNIARTCAVTGASLHLIEPMGFRVTDASLKRAGLDYWRHLNVRYYRSLTHFFAENDGNFYFFSTKARTVHSEARYYGNVYLIFGKETKGLPPLLLYANEHSAVRIPMKNALRSLNLSNAAAIAAYEALRQAGYPDLR